MAKEKDQQLRKGAEVDQVETPAKFGEYAYSFVKEKSEELMRGELKPTGMKPQEFAILAAGCGMALLKQRLDRIEKELGL